MLSGLIDTERSDSKLSSRVLRKFSRNFLDGQHRVSENESQKMRRPNFKKFEKIKFATKLATTIAKFKNKGKANSKCLLTNLSPETKCNGMED